MNTLDITTCPHLYHVAICTGRCRAPPTPPTKPACHMPPQRPSPHATTAPIAASASHSRFCQAAECYHHEGPIRPGRGAAKGGKEVERGKGNSTEAGQPNPKPHGKDAGQAAAAGQAGCGYAGSGNYGVLCSAELCAGMLGRCTGVLPLGCVAMKWGPQCARASDQHVARDHRGVAKRGCHGRHRAHHQSIAQQQAIVVVWHLRCGRGCEGWGGTVGLKRSRAAGGAAGCRQAPRRVEQPGSSAGPRTTASLSVPVVMKSRCDRPTYRAVTAAKLSSG